MKKQTILAISLAILLLSAGVSAASVSAHGWMSSDDLATKLAQRFNLKEADVKAFLADQRAEMHQKHRDQLVKKLDKAVAQGKLTADQKYKILAKLDEYWNKMKDWQALPADERKAKVKAAADELKKWAEDNKIPWHWGWMRHGWWR